MKLNVRFYSIDVVFKFNGYPFFLICSKDGDPGLHGEIQTNMPGSSG